MCHPIRFRPAGMPGNEGFCLSRHGPPRAVRSPTQLPDAESHLWLLRKVTCDGFAAKPPIKDNQPKVRHEKNKEAGQSADANKQIVAPLKSHSRQHGQTIVSAVKNGGRNNGIRLEADVAEKRSQHQGLHGHEEHTRPGMFGVVKPLNDERRMPESPDQANNCGSFPETQATEFPLKETSPAQLLTETGEGVDRYSCEKTL